MTLDSLTQDIAQAEVEFRWLNRKHWGDPVHHPIIRKPRPNYRPLKIETETRIIELAERLARLRNFMNLIAVAQLTNERLANTR